MKVVSLKYKSRGEEEGAAFKDVIENKDVSNESPKLFKNVCY
jgi:hypothetical protein